MKFTDLTKASGLTQANLVVAINAKDPSCKLTPAGLKNYTSGRRVIPGNVFAAAESLWGHLVPQDEKTIHERVVEALPAAVTKETPQAPKAPEKPSGGQGEVPMEELLKRLYEWKRMVALKALSCKDYWESYVSILGAKVLPNKNDYLVCDLARTADGLTRTVLRKTDDAGHPEFDVMDDGFARGFPGDSPQMRAEMRTSHALRRILEKKHGVTGVAFRGMYSLPKFYRLDKDGDPVNISTGKKIKFDEAPGK